MIPFFRNIAIPTMAVFALGSAPAVAADLGGDCCADLEERVAELEASTVRKGNRKVSVTLSGHVNLALFYFDNDDEENLYVADNGVSRTRFRFTGKAKISKDWSAGYKIEIGRNPSTLTVRVDNDNGAPGDGGLQLRHSSWYVKNKRVGKLTVGLTSEVNDGLFHIDTSGSNVVSYASVGWGNDIVFGGTTRRIDAIFVTIDGSRRNLVRYDSPTFAGFTASAHWGEDDIWAVALRYAGTLGDFKVKAGIGYDENDEEDPGDPTEKVWQGSASVLHTPTGLFATFAYGDVEGNSNSDRDVEQWHVKAGIVKKINSLGKTTFYGEYSEVEQEGLDARGDGTRWGLGVVQKVDAAAMELYLGYRNYELDNDVTFGNDTPDIDLVMTGARIKF